ncbi:unnamed protein product [Haemonchus placei]|uniref:Pentatricopeptide repeat-containing protein n=1 Tax=Haemonchus placei TaxID=6290 RepID=A0A0N4W8T9_HAEPC|nr:unnamed protein product [Haemonchus placei]
MEGLLSDLYTTSLDGFVAITSASKMLPIFLEKGVRVDSKTYLKGVLEKEAWNETLWLNSSSALCLVTYSARRHDRLLCGEICSDEVRRSVRLLSSNIDIGMASRQDNPP